MRKTKLGKKLYETALWKVTTVVRNAIKNNMWYIAKEANSEAKGIAYALWDEHQITDIELEKVIQIYWKNRNEIERHFYKIEE